MTYRLYHSPGACSMAAHIAFEEAGAPVETVPVLLSTGENRRPEYLAVHQRGFLPVLEIEGERLTEVAAILLHIARRWPSSALLPVAGSLEEARALEWVAWLTNTLHVAYAGLWRPGRFVADEGAATRIAAEAQGRIEALNREVEGKFGNGRAYAAGESHTLADPFLLVFYRWANRIGLDAPTLYPAWTEWARRMERRPAVARVLAKEGVSLWG